MICQEAGSTECTHTCLSAAGAVHGELFVVE
jgi:hypothetical protein